MKQCPNETRLNSFLNGNLLNSADSLEIEAHLEQCATCVKTLETLSGVIPSLLIQRTAEGPDPYALEARCHEVVDKIVKLSKPAEVPSASQPETFTTLGTYEVIEKLGTGGVGAVYKARHTHLGKIVALKILREADNKDDISRFFREMKAVGSISHPNIVQATDGGVQDDRHYLVMEYLPGLNLNDLSKIHGPLRISDACELIRQAATGLQHIDQHEMVHRDIKPGNLMLVESDSDTTPPVVKILDLGLASLGTKGGIEAEALTMAGQVMGTLDYMAPEQALDSHDVDVRADIYALGATLYKLLCGQAPFQTQKYKVFGRKFNALLTETAPSITTCRNDLPGGLVAVVSSMLHRDPARRPQTPADVVRQLAAFCKGHDLSKLLRTVPISGQETITPAGTFIGTKSKPEFTVSTVITLPKPEVSASGGRSLIKKTVIAIGFPAVALLLGILLYVQTGKATLVIDIKDPTLIATVVSNGVEIQGDALPIKLSPGAHKLKVTRGDFSFETDNFVLNRAENEILTVQYIAGRVSVVRDGLVLKAAELPGMAELPGTTLPESSVVFAGSSTASRDRMAAEWVLKQHGEVRLVSGATIRSLDELPDGEIELEWIDSGIYAVEHAQQDSFDFEQIEILNGLSKLKFLNILRGMHDDAFVKLDNLPSLTSFGLAGQPLPDDVPQITNRAIAMLKRYPKLNNLNLTGVKISDDGFAELFSSPEMQNLQSIQLGLTSIGEKGLEAAAKLPRLRELRFEQCTKTTATALAHLKDSTVEALNFAGALMSADRLVEIAKIPHLKTLGMGTHGFTVQQLAVFAGHLKLELIDLSHSGLDQESLNRIPEVLPGFSFDLNQPNGNVIYRKNLPR